MITQEINQVSHYIYSVRQKVLQKGYKMTLKQYIVAGVVEQAIVQILINMRKNGKIL